MQIAPFRAVRPRPDVAARVASVPYDVVDRAEAATLAADEPLSFLRVVRAELELPADVGSYDDRVYARAKANFEKLQQDGVLLRDAEPSFYAYRLTAGGHAQTGIVGGVHIDDYEHDVIRKHEKTRPEKEDDRTRHILTLGADAEPVLLTYRGRAELDALVAAATATPPLYDFEADDGVRHTVWVLSETATIRDAFGAVPVCYVADGHHRCASAWRAGRERRDAAGAAGPAAHDWFPAVLFPATQLNILPYHRVVTSLGDLSVASFLERLAGLGSLTADAAPQPQAPGQFSFYGAGRWHGLQLDPASIQGDDPIQSLDVDLLQRRVLEPLLGIEDPRTDPRLGFVGGSRGTQELERRVEDGRAALAIAMYPTSIDQLLTVADASLVMPPKSTWFEPKLRSGLFAHVLDD
ncbi:MAG: DUF1015 family protein [Planctomycetota bacterium]